MRNLKKVLSLSLALVMLLGMMVVGAGAAVNFPDADQISAGKVEAAEVMTALGVFKGDDSTGTLNPQAVLTRAEAATLVCNLLLDESTIARLEATGAPFTDVPADHWSAKYVSWCKTNGFVAGRGDGSFGPGDELTNLAFATIMLRVLGYKDTNEGWQGTEAPWAEVAASINSTALRAGLLTNVDSVASTPITRENAMQMTYNVLTADMVEYSGGANINLGGGSVTIGSNRSVVSNTKANDYHTTNPGAPAATADEEMQFCEQYFPGLKQINTQATLEGPTGTSWQNNGRAISTPVLTATTLSTSVKKVSVLSTKGGKDFVAELDATVTYFVNGVEVTATTAGGAGVKWVDGKVLKVEAAEYDPKAGSTEMKVLDTNNNGLIDTVVIIEKSLGEVSSAGVKINKDGKVSVNISGVATISNADPANVHGYADLAAGDVVIGYKLGNGDSAQYFLEKCDSITGVMTQINSAARPAQYTIAGTPYAWNADFGNAAPTTMNGVEAVYYLDSTGAVVKSTATAATGNYAFIVGAQVTVGTSLTEATSVKAEVLAVLSDGTVGTYELKLEKDGQDYKFGATTVYDHTANANAGNTSTEATGALRTAVVNKVFDYSVANNIMTLTAVTTYTGAQAEGTPVQNAPSADVVKGGTTATLSSQVALLTSETVFVSYDTEKKTAQVYTGNTNMPGPIDISEGNTVVVGSVTATANTCAAKVVFTTCMGTAAAPDLVYIDAGKYQAGYENGKTVYTYEAIDQTGAVIPLTAETPLAADASGIYTYTADDKVGEKQSAGANLKTGTAAVSGSLVSVDTTNWYNMTGDTVTVYIGDASELNGSTAWLVLKDNNVVTAYVVPAAPGGGAASVAPADLEAAGTHAISENTNVTTGDVTLGTGAIVNITAGTLTVNGNLTVNQGELNLSSTGKLHVTGNLVITDGTFTDAATTEITVDGATTITPSGKTVAGKLTTAGLTITAGATVTGDVNTTTLTVNGATTITNPGVVKATGTATLGADVTGTGKLTVASFSDAATSAAHAKTTTVEITAAAAVAVLEAVPIGNTSTTTTLIVGEASTDNASVNKWFTAAGESGTDGTAISSAVVPAGTYTKTTCYYGGSGASSAAAWLKNAG